MEEPPLEAANVLLQSNTAQQVDNYNTCARKVETNLRQSALMIAWGVNFFCEISGKTFEKNKTNTWKKCDLSVEKIHDIHVRVSSGGSFGSNHTFIEFITSSGNRHNL